MKTKNNILILTPVKDGEEYLDRYFHNLYQLSYPHKEISIGILESDSNDKTFSLLKQKLSDLQKEFGKVSLLKKDFGFNIPERTHRWSGGIQHERRAILARSRNHLLFRTLDDEDWVLWLDVDLVEYPDKGRKHLDDLRNEGDIVELHSVGGTMLLIRADIHRDGLIFPPYLYGKKNRHIRKTQFFFANWKEKVLGIPTIIKKMTSGEYQGEIETEGLGIMAHDMGYTCWGLPNLEIKHGSK